ncbi:hypothetical protein BBOV_III003070 [Babesia bovis T2Bo]|uniref:Ribosomal RNA-processing protein 7 C-terminal domain-containing protein n=1 Tax=Babesia bovis TaxID=5865 RepID=A7AMT7_BABBO|nr:hypothetical protein BBOV_III003070 [Babesia bovis T2Bo]EDO07871.1 hypothetical protein BBOV_III003070 [Babesia bovis T2Bo]|eukprot:XP_001611439.1 hypothetical protein [Babesia bovis T2Bo]
MQVHRRDRGSPNPGTVFPDLAPDVTHLRKHNEDYPIHEEGNLLKPCSITGQSILSQYLEYRRVKYRAMDLLQKDVDECLMAYDIEADVENRLQRETHVDAEGYILVTHGPVPVKAHIIKDRKRGHGTNITAIDFYRFPNKEREIAAFLTTGNGGE